MIDIPKLGIYFNYMRVIAKKTINAYRECYPEADEQLRAWVATMEERNFKHFTALKAMFNSADLVKDNRVIFNIKGNHFRLIAHIDFNRQAVFIKWFGRHKDYDKIDPSEVKHEYPPC